MAGLGGLVTIAMAFDSLREAFARLAANGVTIASAISNMSESMAAGASPGGIEALEAQLAQAAAAASAQVLAAVDDAWIASGNTEATTAAAWSLGRGGETLRDGVHVGGGYGQRLLWLGGSVYVEGFEVDSTWHRWTGVFWEKVGTVEVVSPSVRRQLRQTVDAKLLVDRPRRAIDLRLGEDL